MPNVDEEGTTQVFEEKEGWGCAFDGKWHYFRKGMSLCNRVGFYNGDVEQGNDMSADNCKTCKKRLLKEKKASGK